MDPSRSFKEIVQARAENDHAFRKALLSEGVEALLRGDSAEGSALIRTACVAVLSRSRKWNA